MTDTKRYTFPMSFSYILTFIFVIAKLFGAITWSWWWVFSPLWIPLALSASILLIVLFGWTAVMIIGLIWVLISIIFDKY